MLKSDPFEIKEGRDAGKTFMITELPALQMHRWSARYMHAIAQGGVIVPDGAELSGAAALAKWGLKVLVLAPIEMAQPLLDELLANAKFIPSASEPRAIHPSDIEDFTTYSALEEAVFRKCVGFFQTGEKSTLESE